jgi:dethiobiotin synthetase
VTAFFLTGTDTGVGKTLVAAGLLLAARARGLTVAGIKPLAAGGAREGEGWRNEDAVLYTRLSFPPRRYAEVNAVTLARPMAPHLAATEDGIALSAGALAAFVRQATANGPDFSLVEGAGGWMVPLNDSESMADVAAALRLPVILVVGMRLGCLNHALLTAGAIRERGLALAGWAANSPWPAMTGLQENITALARRLGAPCLARIPYLAGEAAPERIVPYLDLAPLVT